MAAFFPLLQQLSRKRARQDTEQLQLWAAKATKNRESDVFESNERRSTKRWKKHRSLLRGEEQNREEGEMAQIKLGGGRNRGTK